MWKAGGNLSGVGLGGRGTEHTSLVTLKQIFFLKTGI